MAVILLHAIMVSITSEDMLVLMFDIRRLGIAFYSGYLLLGTYIFSKVMYGPICFDIASIVLITAVSMRILYDTRIKKKVIITNLRIYKHYTYGGEYVIDFEKILFKEYKSLKSIIGIEKFTSFIVKEGDTSKIISKLLKRLHKNGYPNKLLIVNVPDTKLALCIGKELCKYYDNVFDDVFIV
jgi:hypothetical protein